MTYAEKIRNGISPEETTQEESRKDLFLKCREYKVPDLIKQQGLYPYFRSIENTEGSTVTALDRKQVMIGSNNYLGLTHHPRVLAAAKRAIDQFGTGCTGSRFLNGNLKIHEELEERLAHFLGQEAALVFSTGFFCNQGALSTLVGRKDVIYCDRENHASILEGTRLALGTTLKFKHNDIEDLERILILTRDKYEGALIVADGVFSMSGDLLKYPEVVKLAQKYNCKVYVDDAHSLGVLGPQGQGTAHHFGLVKETDLVMATFSKAFASIGGYVAGNKETINFIKHKARPFMFSAALPPAAVGTVLECLSIVQEEPEHLENLWKNVHYMQKEISQMGYNTLNSSTPIIPLLIGEDIESFRFAQKLFEKGVFATPVVKPAVPDGCALIRTSYMATHKREDLDYVLEVLYELGKEFGVLENSERQEVLSQLAKIHFGLNTSAFCAK